MIPREFVAPPPYRGLAFPGGLHLSDVSITARTKRSAILHQLIYESKSTGQITVLRAVIHDVVETMYAIAFAILPDRFDGGIAFASHRLGRCQIVGRPAGLVLAESRQLSAGFGERVAR